MRAIALLFGFILSGCFSVADVNTAFRRIDRQWQLEYQRTEDELRWRVIESDLPTAYKAVRMTFIELGLPIKKESFDDRATVAENEAPTPLTLEEWKEIVREENARMRDTVPWYMSLSENPNKYIVTVKATLRPFEGRTLVLLDYAVDAPELRKMGVIPNQYALPTAVKKATEKVWQTLKTKLDAIKVKEPRRRQPNEFAI